MFQQFRSQFYSSFAIIVLISLLLANPPGFTVSMADESIDSTVMTERFSVPTAQQRAQRKKEIEEIFGLNKRKSKQEQLETSQRMLQIALENEDDPSGTFVLMDLARQQAERAGDAAAASAAIDLMAVQFEFDDQVVRRISVKAASTAPGLTSSERQAIEDLGEARIQQSLRNDQYEQAIEWMKVMEDVARRFRNGTRARQLASRQTKTQQTAQQYREFVNARKIVSEDPSNQQANLTVGRFLIFQKRYWQAGFRRLVQSGHKELASIAEQELVEDKSVEQELRLAESWTTFAGTETNGSESRVLSLARAAAWYQSAILSLSGISKSKAERFLATIKNQGIEPIDLNEQPPGSFFTEILEPPKPATSKSQPSTAQPVMEEPAESSRTETVIADDRFPLLNDGVRDTRWAARGPIDVLSFVQLPRDQISGDWKLSNGSVISPNEKFARLRIPVVPPREYDLTLDVELKSKNRDVMFAMTAPSGHRFGVNFQAYTNRVWNGIDFIDGKSCQKNETKFKGDVLEHGKVNQIVISVRKAGIEVKVNKQMICRYRGEFKRLSNPSRWEEPDRSCLMIGSHDSEMHVHSAVLRSLVGARAAEVPYPNISQRGKRWWRDIVEGPDGQASTGKDYLDDIPESSFHVGRGVLGKHGELKLPFTKTLNFGGEKFEHALTMRPYGGGGTARVTYQLGGVYKDFFSDIGICESKKFHSGKQIPGTLVFEVYGDGKLLARSNETRKTAQRASIEADVSGVKTLSLVVRCRGSSEYAIGAWLNPMVLN